MIRRTPFVVALATLALVLTACGSNQDSSDGSALDRLKKDGLKVSFVNENPWSYTDDDGEFTGAEAEMIKECGERLDFEVKPELTQWDSQLPGLQSKRWDAIVAGMAVSDERLQIAIATQPLYSYGARVLVERGNPLNVHSWSDIAAANAKVGMVSGGSYQPEVEALGITVVNYDSLDAEISDLEAGRIKVLANAETSLAQYLKDNPDSSLELADPWDYEGIGLLTPAWYFNKDHTELRDVINDCVTELKEDGTMAKLLEQFGFNPEGVEPVSEGLPAT